MYGRRRTRITTVALVSRRRRKRHRDPGTDKHERRHDQHRQRGHGDLAATDLLAEEFRCPADQQAAHEHRDDGKNQNSVQAGAHTARGDLTEEHVQYQRSAARGGEAVMRGIHRPRRGAGGRHREQRACGDTEPDFLAFHHRAGCLRGNTAWAGFGPGNQGQHAAEESSHHRQHGKTLTLVTHHGRVGAGEAHRDDENRQYLNDIR
ncbi:Uncharacterised protein [Mycobacteroides abscessus]|nr:Uncharacterised protein [Mycobacteroides abscessus]